MNKNIGSTNGLVDQAKQTVANVASTAKDGVTHQVEQRIDQTKEKALDKLDAVSGALRGAEEKLEGTGPLPDLAEKAAEGIDRLVHYFENKSIGDLLGSAESFARREPALFLGGAVALGIFAGRFLKSSARRGGGGGDHFESYGNDYDGYYDEELSADDLEDDWEPSRRGTNMNFGGPVAEGPMRTTQAGTSISTDVTGVTGASDFNDPRKTKPGL